MNKKLFWVLSFILFLIFPQLSQARENVNYWYIKDFKSEIVVNDDSSLDITEYITADCGSAQKHGIFRTLPQYKQLEQSRSVYMPIKLKSITDFEDRRIDYETSRSRSDGTITWKIGDADFFVTGVNYYKIRYQVKNAILGENDGFNEFYWNLSGNFWDIPIDSFSAKITLPEGVSRDNAEINVYSGSFGEGDTLGAQAGFISEREISVQVDSTMQPGEGATLSVTFPKGIVRPYVPTFAEKYGAYFFFAIPVGILIIFILLWRKFGDDPSINPTVAPEFEIPENLCPIDMGLVHTDGILKNHFISASIINLAVKGAIKIEKIEKKGILSRADFKLIKDKQIELSATEEKLLEKLFSSKSEVLISSLKNSFYSKIPSITQTSENFLCEKKWLKKASKTWQATLISFAVITFVGSFFAFASFWQLAISLMISAVILFIFSFLMKSRPLEGAILSRRILGFKMYMEKAEKYRQKFNEKENIFEKFLPYAIMFGITKLWIAKMKEIYGQEYFNSYAPLWFAGTDFRSFNVDQITSEISALSSNMATTISSSPSGSGSGGGGFSGGGGGGGGGGGW